MRPAPALSGAPTPGRRGGVDLAEIFLFPVRALAMVFRAKHLEALDRAASSGELTLPDSPSQPGAFPAWLAALRQHDWVVYAKPPFAGPEQVLQYLGRYTHRVALSNERLVDLQAGTAPASRSWPCPPRSASASSSSTSSTSASSAFGTSASSPTARALLLRLTGIDIERCQVCGQGRLASVETLQPTRPIPVRAPGTS